jgi:glycosyltransferase involved in cell wall biosynthesis
MSNRQSFHPFGDGSNNTAEYIMRRKVVFQAETENIGKNQLIKEYKDDLPEILLLTSYPPRECGIATYSQDLRKAINDKFSNAFALRICALESDTTDYSYPEEVKHILKTSSQEGYVRLAQSINSDKNIKTVVIEHEFGFFRRHERSFLQLIYDINKPIAVTFHSVLPNPDRKTKSIVKLITAACSSIIVMTHHSAEILADEYNIPWKTMKVIAHGTHIIPGFSKEFLKLVHGFKDRRVLSTFGLLGPGKNIEASLEALKSVIEINRDVLFLIIGKTHPEIIKTEGEKYRESLESKVKEYSLQDNVIFINRYIELPLLLEYLKLTDIYLFTSNDPNQAVSGTFAYAMSCGCPIISTPIPPAKEMLSDGAGILFDFGNSEQLANAINRLLNDKPTRKTLGLKALQRMVATTWENSAVAHAGLFCDISKGTIKLRYNLPAISLKHIMHMTTDIGIIQFSKADEPDQDSGYTLDDNARALIAICMFYKLTVNEECIFDIKKYLDFIKHCQQVDGSFLNYTDKDNKFTDQNYETELDDANGRAVWALGYLISLSESLPQEIIAEAEILLSNALPNISKTNSARPMAFAIKGLYHCSEINRSKKHLDLIQLFGGRIVHLYLKSSDKNWKWFEDSLTYANSLLPESMLYLWRLTGGTIYKDIGLASLDFLLSQTFNEDRIEVISNKEWLQKGQKISDYGEQPIDVADTIMTLCKYYDEFKFPDYRTKIETAFNWFLGHNRLHQIMYNPVTGGCYDGLEETNVNINQGAESTVCYLMARLTIEEHKDVLYPEKRRSRFHYGFTSNMF